jgi:5-deoxy-glucuronate isomerase
VCEDGDLVLIPYGYHSVSAPPGHRVYYLWAIAGDERRLAVFEDPPFAGSTKVRRAA